MTCSITMKRIIGILLLCIAIGAMGLVYYAIHNRNAIKLKTSQEQSIAIRATEALDYAKAHKLNTNYVLLVDYSIPSGTPRLFVWDFSRNKIVARTYVMHGVGKGSTAEKPVFSNAVGSECSSLGKFKVTKFHGGKIKRSYRLIGLEATNSNAWRRGIMIHRSTWVDRWCWTEYIPLHEPSCQGCITVSSKGMTYLEKLINNESEPILLWSYN